MAKKELQVPAGGPAAARKDHRDFTMLTRGYIRDIRLLAARNPAAFQVLLYLAERMTKSNAVVMSAEALGEAIGKSRSTIHRAVTLLEREQWLQVLKSGGTNAYIINSRVIWRDHSGKRFSSFFAEVIISETEQGRTVEAIEAQADQLKHVPIVDNGAILIDDGADLDPPDQRDLLPPDLAEFPRVDRDTGEIHGHRPALAGLSAEQAAARARELMRELEELADIGRGAVLNAGKPLPPR